jgi:hypothetical protein
MKKTIQILVAVFLTSQIYAQGLFDGFMKLKGNLDAAVSYNTEFGNGFTSKAGDLNKSRTTNSISFYTAYGISNKLDIAASLPFISVASESNLQDIQIGLKYNLFNWGTTNKLSFHGAYISSLPVSNYKTQGGDAIGQQAKIHSIKLITQYSFNSNYFIQAQGGYNIALNPVTNSIPFSVKAGWYKNKLYADVWFDYKNAIGGTDYPLSNDFRTLGNSYQKIGCTGFYRISKNFGASINSSYTIGGRNIFKGLALGAALVLKFEK